MPEIATSLRDGPRGRAALAATCAVCACFAVLSAADDESSPGSGHGVSFIADCDTSQGPLELLDCRVVASYSDGFGDTTELCEAFGFVNSIAGPVRVPAIGNMEIIEVSGNTTAVVGGTLPAFIGPPLSTHGGLPGIDAPGEVVFSTGGSYQIRGDDPSPLIIDFGLIWEDLCNTGDPDCLPFDLLETATGAVLIVEFDTGECSDVEITMPVGFDTGGFGSEDGLDVAIVGLIPGTDSGRLGVGLNDGDLEQIDFRYVDFETTVSGLALADFDGADGPDVAVASPADDTVIVLLNDGTMQGTFEAPVLVDVDGRPVALAAADFDGDAAVDLAVVSSDSGTITILGNDGTGSFTTRQTFAVGATPTDVVAEQFLGDELPDLAVTVGGEDTLVVFENISGAFDEVVRLPVGERPARVDPADVDNDKPPMRRLDLVVMNEGSGDVSIVRNEGDGFCELARIAVGASPKSLAVSDYDRDGDDDIFVLADTMAGPTVQLLANEFCSCDFETSCDHCNCRFRLVDILVDPNLELVDSAELTGDGLLDVVTFVRESDACGNDSGENGVLSVLVNGLCRPDIDRSGVVDFNDVLLVLAAWGCEGECSAADATNDGIVDFQDVLEILPAWGPVPDCR